MLLQLLLPALSEEEAVCGRREAAVDCRSHPSEARVGASRHAEEAVCGHREAAAGCRSRPSAARGVSFLRPLWVLLSNVVR